MTVSQKFIAEKAGVTQKILKPLAGSVFQEEYQSANQNKENE